MWRLLVQPGHSLDDVTDDLHVLHFFLLLHFNDEQPFCLKVNCDLKKKILRMFFVCMCFK